MLADNWTLREIFLNLSFIGVGESIKRRERFGSSIRFPSP